MRSVRPAAMERSLDLIYEAAAEPSRWRTALEAFGRAMGAEGVLMQFNPSARHPCLIQTEALDTATEIFIRDGWYRLNEQARRGMEAARRGASIFTEATLFTPDEYMRESLHMEFLRPHGFAWFAGMQLVQTPNASVLLSLQRRRLDEAYSRPEVEHLRKALPHLRRAARLALVLGTERVQGMVDGLSLVGVPAVLIDTDGLVCCVNGPAESLLGNGLDVTAGQFTSPTLGVAARLRALVASLIASERIPSHLGPIQVPRPAGRPLVLHGVPLVGAARNPFGGAAAIVVIVDPDAGTPGAARWLERACGLTPAEARTAALIATGLDFAEIADTREVGIETVRSQAASIAAKTGAHSRGAQVALFSRLLLRASHGR